MTDLTGAELDAAVARVMGLRAEMDEGSVWLLPPTDLSTSSYDWGTPGNRVCAREFRPSQGGAAAWEVLEWVRRQVNVVAVTIESDGNGGVVCMVAPAMSFHGATIGHGPTDAIALCRAVVALGEVL